MVHHQIKVVQALASAITSGGRGANGTAFPNQPEQALKLYEFEGSPFCRRVREVLTLLNLDYEVYPCPKGGTKYRKVVKEHGGKLRFPYFVDENTGTAMYESVDIVDYLFKHYGKSGTTPKKYAHYPKYPVAAFAGTLMGHVVCGSIKKLSIVKHQKNFYSCGGLKRALIAVWYGVC